jgi:hypothetical protein
MNNKAVVAFVQSGKKFPECSTVKDVTSTVTCKEIIGLAGVELTKATAGGGCSLLS